jgi:hypothetical protein
MKKYLITLIVAASATIHAQDAGLESQLQGYWQPDVVKTAALAKKANREMDPLSQAMMGKMVFEFQKDKMTVHGPPGFSSDSPPVPFEVKGEDTVAKSLTLSAGGKEMKVRFDKGQMALNDPESGWTIFNPMSKEDFAKRAADGAKKKTGEGDEAPAAGKIQDVSSKPVPGEPAAGKVGGKEFKVDQASLDKSMAILELRHGDDMRFVIFLFEQNRDTFDGKKYTVTPRQEVDNPHTMKLEFGTAKDGKIPGKIHLRLPDEAGSFVVGTFEAAIK